MGLDSYGENQFSSGPNMVSYIPHIDLIKDEILDKC